MLRYLGATDAIVATLVAGLAAGLFAALIGLVIARYRRIFFAMLTLAISMVATGSP